VAFVILAVVTGGALSWFASTYPDGLEWSIEKVTGKSELEEQKNSIALILKDIQEKTAFLPDYGFRPAATEQKTDESSPVWPAIEPGTSVAGVVGSVIVLMLIVFIGFGIRLLKRR